MKSILLRLTVIIVLFCLSVSAHAQRRNARYNEYIKQYAPLAVEQMQQHKIPASITLAQGLLESGAGYSELARKSNNHFGIKCHSDWRGRKVYHDDDARGECFRAYRHPKDSYEDHSAFLKRGARYAFLFKLKITDYKGWARGLQKCGYATDRAYANRLIKLIEDYDLYRYDTAKGRKKSDKQPAHISRYTVYRTNGLLYVYSNGKDSFDDIAASLGFRVKDLKKYNEVPEDFPLQKNDIVYLEKKKKKADKPNYDHVVQVGESMHSIAQKYGIQIKSLYKMNKKHKDYIPEEGDVLKLR